MEQLIQRLYTQVNVADVIKAGDIFHDITFPKTVQNLVYPSQMSFIKILFMKRPKSIFREGKFNVFERININDIAQDDLGDCYFLCSISAVAAFPNRIMELFLTKEVNKADCYAIVCFILGQCHTHILGSYCGLCKT